MKNKYLLALILVVLMALPFMVAYKYLDDAFPYQNSPHLSTVWDKSGSLYEITQNEPLRQNFEVLKTGLDRIDLRLRKGAGEYRWSIVKNETGETITGGLFRGSDVQNYDFISLNLAISLDEHIGEELSLIVERNDEGLESGVAAFATETEGIVFQLYYRD